MPGEVTLAHQVGKEFMPVTGGSQVAYVLLETKPTELMAQVRMPLNFALVLDHSGSMKGAKLKNVKEAVKMVINRMILLIDGVTYGDSDRCRQLARDARAAGISIYPLGIGQDWDESLLDTIGEMSGGMPAEFIRNPADAMTVFEQQLQSAVAVA